MIVFYLIITFFSSDGSSYLPLWTGSVFDTEQACIEAMDKLNKASEGILEKIVYSCELVEE